MSSSVRTPVLFALVALVMASACGVRRAPDKDGPDALAGGTETELSIPGFDDRTYTLRLPPAYDGATAIPVVLALHGGGGNKKNMVKLTCEGGDTGADHCLSAVADREGFALVVPDGTPGELLEDLRTWNAGGGKDGWQCVSGKGCADGVDDLAYFDALHDELQRAFHVDDARVYATGLSNGAAMAHRLACERSTRFAAIAPVAGGNQVAEVQGCTIARPVAVLEIHGTADPCWTFDESSDACAQQDGLKKVGVEHTVDGWAERNGCVDEVVVEDLDDVEDDGTTTTREVHGGCVDGADVVLLRSEGGGHTWPGGHQYLDDKRVGRVVKDFSASEEMWRFFAAHPRG
jgi:polyhydroxybutyrate depolymerase